MSELVFESLFIQTNNTDKLHLKRIYSNPTGNPVFMVHGSIENGKIFYTEKGKGFACYLANKGYDVFVADLRGRGQCEPQISKNSDYGLTEILWEDFPKYISKIKELKGDTPQIWVSHSWGGCLFLAYLARRFKDTHVKAMVFFATKRRINIFGLKKFYMVDLIWNLLAKLIIAIKGYLPAKKIGLGSDDETKKTHYETNIWVYSKKWLDWNDNFNYAEALKEVDLPPILTITGANDKILGNPIDVEILMKECGAKDYTFNIISKANGFKNDYDHIDIMTHKDAPEDHFEYVNNWLNKVYTESV